MGHQLYSILFILRPHYCSKRIAECEMERQGKENRNEREIRERESERKKPAFSNTLPIWLQAEAWSQRSSGRFRDLTRRYRDTKRQALWYSFFQGFRRKLNHKWTAETEAECIRCAIDSGDSFLAVAQPQSLDHAMHSVLGITGLWNV